jgi:hypothetical protein
MRLPHVGLQKGGGGGPPGSGTQGPQSCGHESEFSLKSHTRLPQKTPGGQSRGQLKELSVGPQIPSPHVPQSWGQLKIVSGISQRPLPQKPKPQSRGHVDDDSPNSRSQNPSPQYGLQSVGQLKYASPYWVSQTPLPHELIVQSCGQERRSSPASHRPLPQRPQSIEQFSGVSPGSQRPLPQRKPKQSWGQVICSPGSHTPLLQSEPQSRGQLTEVSPRSQTPLPHVGATQSCGHVA